MCRCAVVRLCNLRGGDNSGRVAVALCGGSSSWQWVAPYYCQLITDKNIPLIFKMAP